MQDSNPVLTPLNPLVALSPASQEDHSDHKMFPYLEVIGCLNHAAVNTFPDICHAVSTLAQFSNCFGSKHVIAVKHLLRFVPLTVVSASDRLKNLADFSRPLPMLIMQMMSQLAVPLPDTLLVLGDPLSFGELDDSAAWHCLPQRQNTWLFLIVVSMWSGFDVSSTFSQTLHCLRNPFIFLPPQCSMTTMVQSFSLRKQP